MQHSILSEPDNKTATLEDIQTAERLDQYLTLPGMVHPLVSRDGKWVAWTWFRAGPSAEAFAAPTDGSLGPIRLTNSPENTTLLSWAPDSRSVIVQQDKDGNERYQLFQVDLVQPGSMRPLTEANPQYYLRGGDLHANNRWLVYGANFDAKSNKEIEATWIYRHDLQTGERIPLAKPEKATAIWPQLSPTGDHVLYTRRDLHPSGQQIWLVDIGGRQDRELFNFGDKVKTTAAWFPDGRRIVVVTEHDSYRRLGVYDLKTSQLQWLIDDPGINIEAAIVPHGSNQIVVSEVREARATSFLVDPQTRAITRPSNAAFDNLVLLAPTEAKWVGQIYSSTQPEELISFSINSPKDFITLSRVWEQTLLTPQDLYGAENFHWESMDGRRIQGWLYQTQKESKGTVIYVHGGPTFHSENRVHPEIQFLVDQGFNVLDPNYRGSTGFSLEFRESIKVDGWGGKDQEDIRCGIEALIATGVAVRGKVGITGTSYGGYSAWFAITHFSPEVATASAPICGMTDLVVDYETTRPDLRPYSEEMMGGSPLAVPDRYYERSPIHFISRIRGSVLIVQGMKDPNVTPENVRAVVAALEKAGVAYELLVFEDEGHGIYKRQNQKVLYQRLAEFFASSFSAAGDARP